MKTTWKIIIRIPSKCHQNAGNGLQKSTFSWESCPQPPPRRTRLWRVLCLRHTACLWHAKPPLPKSVSTPEALGLGPQSPGASSWEGGTDIDMTVITVADKEGRPTSSLQVVGLYRCMCGVAHMHCRPLSTATCCVLAGHDDWFVDVANSKRSNGLSSSIYQENVSGEFQIS